jgi:hypothetical protein
MIKALIFSKDRPLQLHAYLDSLFGLTNIRQEQVSIIVPSLDDYMAVSKEFPEVVWINEKVIGGFDLSLREYVNSDLNDDDILLFGCDDVVYIRPCSLAYIPKILENKDYLGFSLRLGKNIVPRPLSRGTGMVFSWPWAGFGSHWGYPFELMASCYRGSLVKEIVNSNKGQMHCPNHLESYGVTYCINKKGSVHPEMAMFNSPNYAVAMDVNRVQHHFQNKFTGSEMQDVEYLKKIFREGKRLDWTELFGIQPQDCFVGNLYWKVK